MDRIERMTFQRKHLFNETNSQYLIPFPCVQEPLFRCNILHNLPALSRSLRSTRDIVRDCVRICTKRSNGFLSFKVNRKENVSFSAIKKVLIFFVFFLSFFAFEMFNSYHILYIVFAMY